MKGIHSEIVRDRRDGAPWRVTFRRTEAGIGIYNPTRRKMALVIFMIVWLAGWAVGEYFALTEILRSGSPIAVDLFLLVWVTAWTLGGVIVSSVIAWQLFGSEKLFLIDGGGIVAERGIGPFTRRKVFPAEQVTEVGLAPSVAQSAADGFLSRGRVRFHVAGNARGFGIELDDEEAERVVDLIRDFIERHQGASGGGGGDAGATA